MKFVPRVLSTMFGIGYLPFAPGTWGSIAAFLLWYSSPLPENQMVFLGLTVLVSIVGIWASQEFEKNSGEKDPSVVIIDEWAGQWIALLFIERSLLYGGIALILFRIFDIIKPGPVKWADNKGGGIGIMGDDIIAGLISLIILQVVKIWL